jgi:transcriptional regulator with XRE-family HTH domain
MKSKQSEKNAVDKHVGSRIRMRRMMLSMSQTKLGHALDISFQQVQKYEKGTNRVGSSRLQHISAILQVPVSFFFEGLVPEGPRQVTSPRASAAQLHELAGIDELMATRDGLVLAKAFMKIGNVQLRRRIVAVVEDLADDRD